MKQVSYSEPCRRHFWPSAACAGIRSALLLVCAFWLAHAFGAEDAANWPHWRGSDDNGSATQGSYPIQWDATNVLWKASLPGKGCSTPVVWARHIYLTAPVNEN